MAATDTQKNKTSGLRYIIRFAVPMALLVTCFVPHAFAHGGHHGFHGPADAEEAREHVRRRAERLLNHVDATDEQRQAIAVLVDGFAENVGDERALRRQHREAMRALLTAETIDAEAIETERRSMVRQLNRRSRKLTRFFVQVAEILTPEQRVEIAELMASRRAFFHRD